MCTFYNTFMYYTCQYFFNKIDLFYTKITLFISIYKEIYTLRPYRFKTIFKYLYMDFLDNPLNLLNSDLFMSPF